jgi:hypothetical protein
MPRPRAYFLLDTDAQSGHVVQPLLTPRPDESLHSCRPMTSALRLRVVVVVMAANDEGWRKK